MPELTAAAAALANGASPAYLCGPRWVRGDSVIGALDLEWNFLEGGYPVPERTPAAIHFINGGPWFARWQDVAYADLWCRYREVAEQASATAVAA